MLTGILNDLLVLGLTDINVERLKAGDPIHFEFAKRGIVAASISRCLIFHATSEQALLDQLVAKGLVTKDTTVADLRNMESKQ